MFIYIKCFTKVFAKKFLFFGCTLAKCFVFAGRHTKLMVKRPQPCTSDSNHLHNHANRARKSWRSDVSIILPGWRRHTGGSRAIPTVHPCGFRSGGCGWLKPQTHHEPKRQTLREGKVPHGSGAWFKPHHAAVARHIDDVDPGQEDSQDR